MNDDINYPNLYEKTYPEGVFRAPRGYAHNWIVVTKARTFGMRTRAEARAFWRQYREKEGVANISS